MDRYPPYWTDPTEGSFDVFIEDVKMDGEKYQVILREDVIRPAGGGQAGDRGILRVKDRAVSIEDTIIESGRTTLIVESQLSKESEASLEIDMAWRRAMMRNHTSEHLFVSIMKKRYPDLEVGDLWIDGEHGTVELLNIQASFENIFAAESEVQAFIDSSVVVKTEFVEADKIDPVTRAREGVTSKHDVLRVVRVGDLDSSACSGIHVGSTDQIDFFKVIDVKHEDAGTRIEFVSGERAIRETKEVYNSVLQRKSTYPFEMEQVGAVLDGAKTATDDRPKLIERIGKLISSGVSAERVGDVLFRHEYLPGFTSKDLKNLANSLAFEENSVLFLFSPGQKAQVIFRTYSTAHDAAYYISEAVKKYGGRGGGSKENFTGGFTDAADSDDLYKMLVSAVRENLNQ